MPQATYAVTINRPIEAVFDSVADGENGARWRPGVIDIKRVSGSGLGARYSQGVRGPMNRRIAADYEVTAFEPNKRLEFRTIAGPVRPHGRYDFEPDGAGTRLTFSLDAQIDGIRRLFLGGMVQSTMDTEVRNLDNLKRLLES